MKPGLLWGYLGLATAALVCVFAIVRGGPLERRAGIIVGLGWVASLGVQQASRVLDPYLALTVVDVTALLALVSLVWRRRWVWLTAAVGFQGLAVAIDLVRSASPSTRPWAYLTALAIAGYGLLAVVLFATLTTGRRAGNQVLGG